MIAKNSTADINVIALVGERGREVREFIERDLGEEGRQRSVVVVATSDESSMMRMKCPMVATTIAEYFRNQGKDVLLMMDSLTRFAMAKREIGLYAVADLLADYKQFDSYEEDIPLLYIQNSQNYWNGAGGLKKVLSLVYILFWWKVMTQMNLLLIRLGGFWTVILS